MTNMVIRLTVELYTKDSPLKPWHKGKNFILYTEAVAGRCAIKDVFLKKNCWNAQENTSYGVIFCEVADTALYWK